MKEQGRSAEERLAGEILMSPGVLKRAGQAGIIAGLDWGAALALIPGGADRDRVVALLKAGEVGMLEGVADSQPDQEGG